MSDLWPSPFDQPDPVTPESQPAPRPPFRDDVPAEPPSRVLDLAESHPLGILDPAHAPAAVQGPNRDGGEIGDSHVTSVQPEQLETFETAVSQLAELMERRAQILRAYLARYESGCDANYRAMTRGAEASVIELIDKLHELALWTGDVARGVRAADQPHFLNRHMRDGMVNTQFVARQLGGDPYRGISEGDAALLGDALLGRYDQADPPAWIIALEYSDNTVAVAEAVAQLRSSYLNFFREPVPGRLTDAVRVLGRASSYLGFGTSAADQWATDDGRPFGERAARAGVRGGGATLIAGLFAAGGTALGGPVVGLGAGAFGGWLGDSVMGELLNPRDYFAISVASPTERESALTAVWGNPDYMARDDRDWAAASVEELPPVIFDPHALPPSLMEAHNRRVDQVKAVLLDEGIPINRTDGPACDRGITSLDELVSAVR